LNPRFLLDTHVVVRWLGEPKKLSREQLRTLEGTVRRTEPVAVSAISLLEISGLTSAGQLKLKISLNEFFDAMRANRFLVLPLSYEVAAEAALLGNLRDPADRAIVATARVHRLSLVTSDQKIIESKLVPVVA